MARRLPALRTAVVHPVDEASLTGAVAAQREALIEAVLWGREAKIPPAARNAPASISRASRSSRSSTATPPPTRAVALAREGRAEVLMKGALHTDELMRAVMRADSGLRTARRLSHVFVDGRAGLIRPLLITDAAINIAPDADGQARHRAERHRPGARSCGSPTPRSRSCRRWRRSTRRCRRPSTPRPCARWPIAARSPAACSTARWPSTTRSARRRRHDKGIVSAVAGRADILVAPDLEAGNMLAKQLTFLADADAAGMVLGARVPIMLTSRADGVRARLGSCALAMMVGGAGNKALTPCLIWPRRSPCSTSNGRARRRAAGPPEPVRPAAAARASCGRARA